MSFKILNTNTEVDLIPYIKEYINNHNNVDILISCDSQNSKKQTIFGITLCLYIKGKGGHVLWDRNLKVRIKDNYSRLIQEVWLSIELAEKIKNETGIITKYIDIDLNGLDIYDSNKVLSSAIGICNSFGYTSRYKHQPGDPALLTYASDKVCR